MFLSSTYFYVSAFATDSVVGVSSHVKQCSPRLPFQPTLAKPYIAKIAKGLNDLKGEVVFCFRHSSVNAALKLCSIFDKLLINSSCNH